MAAYGILEDLAKGNFFYEVSAVSAYETDWPG
jgi:hypothetical protein